MVDPNQEEQLSMSLETMVFIPHALMEWNWMY